MQVILANPEAFCAGVERAIAIVERALEKFGAHLCATKSCQQVCLRRLRARAVFVEELDEVPTGATVVFSAHGVSKVVPPGRRA